jgi:HAD superfamily hydrolase (TIGR01509 family)
MDGVLLDSMGMWNCVGEIFLKRHGIGVPNGLSEKLRELTVEQAASYFQSLGVGLNIDEIIKEIDAIPLEAYRTSVPAKPGVMDYIRQKNKQQIPMCVLTATNRTAAKAALERVGILPYLQFVLTCEELHTGKDNPRCFLTAAEKRHLSPENIVVFEDSFFAARTAKNSGFRVVGVYDATAESEISQMKQLCDDYVSTFEEAEICGL